MNRPYLRLNRESFLAICVAVSFIVGGCAILDSLKPHATDAAIALLMELETLLRDYESMSVDESTPPDQVLAITARKDALYRNISQLLRLTPGVIPEKRLRPYRARLDAASRAAP